jgi:hypothetical protein
MWTTSTSNDLDQAGRYALAATPIPAADDGDQVAPFHLDDQLALPVAGVVHDEVWVMNAAASSLSGDRALVGNVGPDRSSSTSEDRRPSVTSTTSAAS